MYCTTSHGHFPQLQPHGGEIWYELVNLEANIALGKKGLFLWGFIRDTYVSALVSEILGLQLNFWDVEMLSM